MQDLHARVLAEVHAQLVALHLLLFGLVVRDAMLGGGSQALRDGTSRLRTPDGRVCPYAVDFEQAAEGPDHGGEDVDGC